MKDVKGQQIPDWARYVVAIDASAGYTAEQNQRGGAMPFAIMANSGGLADVLFIDNDAAISYAVQDGYNPIACLSVGAGAGISGAYALYPLKPSTIA